MPETPQIPLTILNPGVDQQFCDIKTPKDLLIFVAENIVGNGQAVAALFTNDVVYSPTEPQGAQRGKLWVKETGGVPRGLGLFIDGAYVIIPIPQDATPVQELPNGSIVPWVGSGSVPTGWGAVPVAQATAIGLSALTGAQYIIRSA